MLLQATPPLTHKLPVPPSKKLRVAVVGGDEKRTERAPWPKGINISFYPSEKYGGQRAQKALRAALQSNKIDILILLTNWLGHSTYGMVRDLAQCNVVHWDRGTPEAAEMLAGLVHAHEHPELAGERSPLLLAPPPPPEPAPEEPTPKSFPEALRAALEASQMSRKEVAELLETEKRVMDGWMAGTRVPKPRRYGRILALFPELASCALPVFKGARGIVVPLDKALAEIEAGKRGEALSERHEEPEPPVTKPEALEAYATPVTPADDIELLAQQYAQALKVRKEKRLEVQWMTQQLEALKVEAQEAEKKVDEARAKLDAAS
jgi:hypothetical protein